MALAVPGGTEEASPHFNSVKLIPGERANSPRNWLRFGNHWRVGESRSMVRNRISSPRESARSQYLLKSPYEKTRSHIAAWWGGPSGQSLTKAGGAEGA